MPLRHKLPNRRNCTQISVRYPEYGKRYHITLGHDLDGSVKECWLHGSKSGSDMAAVLNDACILFSILLQCGYKPEAIAASLGNSEEGRTSPLGLVIDEIMAVQNV